MLLNNIKVSGWPLRLKVGEESPDSRPVKGVLRPTGRKGQSLTATESNLRESAAETILPRKRRFTPHGEKVKSELVFFVLEIKGYNSRCRVTGSRGKPCPEQEQTFLR
jgi:hypothetical protein